jgi:hypothetical protein
MEECIRLDPVWLRLKRHIAESMEYTVSMLNYLNYRVMKSIAYFLSNYISLHSSLRPDCSDFIQDMGIDRRSHEFSSPVRSW